MRFPSPPAQRMVIGFIMVLALCVFFTGVLLSGNAVQLAADELPEVVAFDTSQISSPGHIYIMNPDGSGEAQLTTAGDNNTTPRLSPDGRKVLFTRYLSSNYDVYQYDIDQNVETRLTDNPAIDGSADWSPDGSKIAFNTDRYGAVQDIAIMDLSSGTIERLTTTSDSDIRPFWSSDNSRIGFTRIRPTSQELWWVAPDGSQEERLCAPLQGTDFKWSPDMSKIAYISTGFPSQVFIIDIDCSGRKQLTFGQDVDAFSWSPDGQQIIFDAGNNNATASLNKVNIDGSGLTLVRSLGHRPDWSVVRPLDSDGDGIPDVDDECPLEDATGFDANLDGCIDRPEDFSRVIAPLPINNRVGLENQLILCNDRSYSAIVSANLKRGNITESDKEMLLAYFDNVCGR